MTQKQSKTLISSVTILGVAGLMAKVISVFFRLPLANLLGTSGMAVFQTVYPTYTLLVSLSTAGIPVAISRLVSESITVGDPRRARMILRTSIGLLSAIGAVLTLLLIAGSGLISGWIGAEQAQPGFAAIAPSILFASVLSAFRGYLQGRNRMAPTAISQLVEQVTKVLISYPLAAIGMRTGVAEAATGALLGVSAGELLALGYLAIVYMKNRRTFVAEEAGALPAKPEESIVRQLTRIALPITLGALLVPLSGFLDSSMIRLRLMAGGMGEELRESLYGLLTGYVSPLINLPTVLATAVCIGLVPVIAAARVEGRQEDMRSVSTLGLRLATLIGLPCAVGMSLLSTEIIRLLYPGLTGAELSSAGSILGLSAWSILLFTYIQATTGILQGAGLQRVPVISLAIGLVCKVVLNYVLIAMPGLNIYGAPIASMACYFVSVCVNMVWILRRVGVHFDIGRILVRPVLAAAGMAAAVFGVTRILSMDSRMHTILAVGIGGIVYIALVFVLGALQREDMAYMPGGRKIDRLMQKLRIWR